MKKIVIVVLSILIIIGTLLGAFYLYNFKAIRLSKNIGKWKIVSLNKNRQLPWIGFSWATDSGGKKVAMYIPARIENLPDKFNFQFDIGANLSMIYGNTLRPFVDRYPILQKKLNTTIIHKDTVCYLSDLHLETGDVACSSPAVFIRQDYGDAPSPDSVSAHTFRQDIGTIGVDICKNKVLIIDYPHNRLCIVDSVPAGYHTTWSEITLDMQGRPVLKMEYKGKNYKIMFDCGSSAYPIIARQKIIDELSGEPGTDTSVAYAWGKLVTNIGRQMKDSFTLAGYRFGNVKVYTTDKGLIPYGCDGITGNVLFLGKVLIVDFKHKKLGLM